MQLVDDNLKNARACIFDSSGLKTVIAQVLTKIEGLKIVSFASDTAAGLEVLRNSALDLVLINDSMPHLDGLVLTQTAKSIPTQPKVIVLSAVPGEARLFATLGAGAEGYCINSITSQKIQNVTEAVLQGAIWFDPDLAPTIKNMAARLAEQSEKKPIELGGLSSREIEVLSLLSLGLTNIQIGLELVISKETVKTHVRNIIRKLAVQDRTQAAVEALKRQIVG